MAEPQSAVDRIVRETLGNQLATIISLQAQLEEAGQIIAAFQAAAVKDIEAEKP